MRVLLFVLILCFLDINLSAQELIKNNGVTKVDFKIKNIGMYVKGNFGKVEVTNNFDQHNLAKSFIHATIDVKSLNTNNTKRDKHLSETDYFDAANYGQIKLRSVKIERGSGNIYKLTGKLTIKRTTKTITIPLKVMGGANEVRIEADFELNRRDFEIGGKSWVLSNIVKIHVKHTIKK